MKHRRYWDVPRIAYEVTALLAAGDDAIAEAACKELKPAGLAELVITLGAHARHAAWTAHSPARAPVIIFRQHMALMHQLGSSSARDLATTALQAGIIEWPAQLGPDDAASLRDAARCLAGIIIATMTEAGWNRRAVTIMCRRAGSPGTSSATGPTSATSPMSATA